MHEAKKIGIKKSVTTNISMGITQCIIFGAYALGFWYGTKLTVDEPHTYTIGKVLIVSLFTCLLLWKINPTKIDIANFGTCGFAESLNNVLPFRNSCNVIFWTGPIYHGLYQSVSTSKVSIYIFLWHNREYSRQCDASLVAFVMATLGGHSWNTSR